MNKSQNKIYDNAAMRIILQPLIEEELLAFDEYNLIPHNYSKDFTKRVYKVFRNDRIKRRCKTIAEWTRRVAVCLMVFITLILVACASIKPIREKIADAFVTWYEKRNEIVFEYIEEEAVMMLPTYVPEGFVETYRDVNESLGLITYENDNLDHYVFSCYLNDGKGELVDNEGGQLVEIEYNGGKAIYYDPLYEGEEFGLIWQSKGYVYNVITNISKEELFRFAESIE